MRIIAVANQKGGVGKTTTVVNVASALANQGYNVMLIDLDPQAHMTTFLGIDPQELQQTAYSVLTQSTPLEQALLRVRERIQLLSSGLDLAAAEQELVSVVGRETVLRDAIESYQGHCDYLFIDCPPSLGLLTLNALGASDEVFIPLQPHFLSLQGLSQLLETVLLVQRRINPKLVVSGLMFCMFDSRTSLSGEIVREIEEFAQQQRSHNCPWRNIRIFDTRIRRNVKLAESPSHGQSIFEYEINCHGATDYQALAEEIIAMEAKPLPAVTCPPPSSEIPQEKPVASSEISEKLIPYTQNSSVPTPPAPRPAQDTPAEIPEPLPTVEEPELSQNIPHLAPDNR